MSAPANVLTPEQLKEVSLAIFEALKPQLTGFIQQQVAGGIEKITESHDFERSVVSVVEGLQESERSIDRKIERAVEELFDSREFESAVESVVEQMNFSVEISSSR